MRVKRKQILWFIIFRLIILTSLVVTAVGIQFAAPEYIYLTPLYYVIMGAYFLSVIYLILYFWNRYLSFQAYLQVFFDLLLITFLVYISGGLRGSFYFLYIFSIIAASIVLSSRDAYITAALSCIFFGVLVDGMYFGFIPYFQSGEPLEVSLAFVLSNILFAWAVFFLVAFLVNYLMGSLRKTSAELESAQKELEVKKNLALAGEISAQLAHEIRNPLAAISGSVQVLRDSLKISGEEKKLMNVIVDESDRMSQSIEQFLNLASPKKKTFTRFNLSDAVKETITLLQRGGELDEKVKIKGNFSSQKVPYYGSKDRIKQISWNLIKNAARAMPEGGDLNININNQKKHEVEMIFSDTGSGMNQEVKEKLFEPFHPGFEGGLGIGMTVVHRMVEECDGHIEVESELNKGTTVRITLPKMEPPPKIDKK
ncbi:MAG: ATP-binding protein [Acidobacteriota bacterium]